MLIGGNSHFQPCEHQKRTAGIEFSENRILFSWIFPGFSDGFHGLSRVFPGFSHGFPMFSMVIPWLSHGFPMVFPCFPTFFPMESPLFFQSRKLSLEEAPLFAALAASAAGRMKEFTTQPLGVTAGKFTSGLGMIKWSCLLGESSPNLRKIQVSELLSLVGGLIMFHGI